MRDYSCGVFLLLLKHIFYDGTGFGYRVILWKKNENFQERNSRSSYHAIKFIQKWPFIHHQSFSSQWGERGTAPSLWQIDGQWGREERTGQGRRLVKVPQIHAWFLLAITLTSSQRVCSGQQKRGMASWVLWAWNKTRVRETAAEKAGPEVVKATKTVKDNQGWIAVKVVKIFIQGILQ